MTEFKVLSFTASPGFYSLMSTDEKEETSPKEEKNEGT